MRANRKRPIDKRRKQQIVEIVGDLLRAAVIHREIERRYRKGELRFLHVEELIDDKGHSILYRLKGNCHALFRQNNDASCGEEERLLDLAVSSIFHEAMKLRENLYQVEMYSPRYRGFQPNLPAHGAGLLDRFGKIMLRAEQGVDEGIADIRALFGDTLDQLFDLIRGYGDNDLLVRFLLFNQSLFAKAYGRRQLEKLFASMFRRGLLQAYWVGTMSCFQSGYYDMASQLIAKAIPLCPNDQKLKFLFQYAKGLSAYYDNNYQGTLRFFSRLPILDRRFQGKRAYLKQAVGLCREIAAESLDERKQSLGRRAEKTAKHLQTAIG
jgi:hypothetical protein